jgi:hypothetical protein
MVKLNSSKEAVMAKISDVMDWIKRDFKRLNPKDSIEIMKNGIEATENRKHLSFRIYTDTNIYNIVAKEKSDYRLSYLGCTSTCRKPRAGEDWNRGNDLADGELNETTWQNILADIVSYEMVKVHMNKEKLLIKWNTF